MTQGTFRFSAPEKARLRVPALIQALDGKGWRKRRDLERELGWDERTVRAVAAVSEGQIISGQRGYCLTAEATTTDVQHFVAWMKSQGREMLKRGIAAERAMHRRTESHA